MPTTQAPTGSIRSSYDSTAILARSPGDTGNLLNGNQSVIDFGHFHLEQTLQEYRRCTGKDNLRIVILVVHTGHHGTRRFSLAIEIARNLFRLGHMLAAAAAAQERWLARFEKRTFTALFEEDGGYTSNYIRVYAPEAKEGGMYEVRLEKREKDGYRVALLRPVPGDM